MVCEFRVDINNNVGGLADIYVDELGHHDVSVNGTVSIRISHTWKEPFEPSTSRYHSDHIAHAGRYVLDGIKVESTVSFPALNEPTTVMLG